MSSGEHALPRERERRPAVFGSAGLIERAAALRPAWILTGLLVAAYLIVQPASPDLAAASYRSELFSRVGFSLWDNSWYGGHHLPAYSLLAPGLGALIGPGLVAALSVAVSVVLFERLIAGRFPPRAIAIAALSFALGAGVALFSSRVPYDLGLTIGLGALLLYSARRWALAGVLCVLCSLASPVAGVFLALALFTLALTLGRGRRRAPLLLTVATLAPIGFLALAFPEGGTQPYVFSSFFPAFVGVLLLAALLTREQRVVLTGLILYALLLLGAYVMSSPVGGNAGRLAALVGAPLAALLLVDADRPAAHSGSLRTRLEHLRRWLGHPWPFLAVMVVLTYWQVQAPANDVAAIDDNGSVHAYYYAPLVAELHRLHVGYGARPARIEIVPTSSHWEARFVAPYVMLARGWERQLDQERNEIFYEEQALTAASYRAWLLEGSVSLIALPDAHLDYSAQAEASLLRGPLPPYLREVWHSAHWRLFEVPGASPLASAPARVQAIGTDSVTLALPRAGAYTVRVHFTPYWALAAGFGCVAQAPGEWTRLRVPRAERVHLEIDFSLARVFEHGPRCS